MTTTEQLTIPDTCPPWCAHKGQDHDYDDDFAPEDAGYRHEVTVDS